LNRIQRQSSGEAACREASKVTWTAVVTIAGFQ
jgi:hypothetical protein